MTGPTFAIFYTVLGIPIARIAETRNRPYIIGDPLGALAGMRWAGRSPTPTAGARPSWSPGAR